jgi:type I restriction enzyme S subunit
MDSISESINVGIVIRPKRYYTSKDEGTPAFRNCNIQGGSIDDSEWVYLKATAAKENPRSVVRYGDVLIARSGNAGNCCVVPKTYSGYGAIDVIIARPLLKFVSPDFLAVNLCAASTQTMLASISRGVALSHLGVTTISSLPMPLPPLTEQKRIVAKVKELFAIADSLGVAADGLENAAKRLDKKILDLAIRGKLVPQDPNNEPASELVKRIAASHKSPCKNQGKPIDPPFEIPASWEWVRLGLLVQVISGVSYSKGDITESGIRILRGGNLNGNAELTFYDDDVFISPNYYDNDNEIQCGDIVIVASTGSSKVIGRPAIATHDMSGVQIGAFLRIVRAHEREFSKWIATLFCSNYYRTHIRKMSKGTNIKNLKAEYITGFAIPLPPLAEQKRIVAKIEELRAVIKPLTM